MKWIFPCLIISVVIESTMIPSPVTAVLIIFIAIGLGERSLWWAFLTGLIIDFLAIRPTGLSSLYFLAVCFIIIRYQQKIYLSGKIYTLIFIAVATSLYSLLFYTNLSAFSTGLTLSVAIICLIFSPRLFPEIIGNKKKLSV